MTDLSQLSDADLIAQYQQATAPVNRIHQLETNGAPDSSGITNASTGASGSMQVMKATAGDPGFGVKPSNGTREDTARMGRDYYAAMQKRYGDDTIAAAAYNWGPGKVDKWMAAGADPSKLPDETLKYMYNFNKMGPKAFETRPAEAPADTKTSTPDDSNSLWNNVKGAGLQAANIGVGALEAVPAGALGLYKGVTEGPQAGVEAATKFMGDYSGEKGLEALGVDTSAAKNTSAYRGVNNAMDFAFNTLPGMAAEQANQMALPSMMSGGGMAPSQTDVNQVSQAVTPDTKAALQLGMLAEPLAHVPGMIRGRMGDGAAAELDKLNGEPTMGDGVSAAQGDFFNDNTFQGPPRPADFETPTPMQEGAFSDIGSNVRDRRQGRFDFENDLQETSNGPLTAAENGDIGTPKAMEEAQPFKDATSQRVQEFNDEVARGTQRDLFEEPTNADHPYDALKGEEARPLDRNEFEQTMNTLADTEGTRMTRPEDMDAAYDKYLNTISDKQGGLFDRATIAANFVKAVQADIVMDRVNNHPVVQANRAKIDQIQKQVEAGQTNQYVLDKAIDTLNKSIENIGKNFEPAAKQVAPWAKDGTVNMFTFGHLPTLWKSIGSLLKGIHGLVFKKLDKALPKVGNLDKPGKIFAQGLRDRIEKEAKREWPQAVNEQPKKTLQGVDGLREALKDELPFGEDGLNLSPEQVAEQVKAAPDTNVGTIAENVLQGGKMLTQYTRNPLVKYVTEGVDKAIRRSDNWLRENIIGKNGLRTKMQAMSSDELTGIRTIMEMNEGKREFSAAELKSKGYSDRQIEYYQQSRALVNQMFDRFNKARTDAGLRPVDKRIGYIAGYFMGDFKRVITDAEGKVVAVIGHNTRRGVETLTKRFRELHPDGANLKSGEIRMNRLPEEKLGNSDPFQGYMDVLNHLAETNADVSTLMDTYRDYQTRNAQAAMQNRAKFKSNEPVNGAEGRKAWQSAKKNALDGARQELRYLDSMNKWSEMQKAVEDSQKLLSDPDIIKDKPNAAKLSQDYLDSVQHRNLPALARAVNGITNTIADVTGLGPTVLRGANNTVKTAALLKFVGLFKLSHSLVTLMQPLQAIPNWNMIMRSKGLDIGLVNATAGLRALGSLLDPKMTGSDFHTKAMQYAKDNGTLDVGMSKHLDNVTKGSAKGEWFKHNVLEANVQLPEYGTRKFTYMYYSNILKDMGLPEKEIFPVAHNLTKNVMVDYAPHERSQVFGKVGVLGDIASTLTRFKYNQISTHMVAAKAGMLPLMTTLLTSIAAGGIRGVIGYEAANVLTQQVTQWLANNGVIDKATNLDEMFLHALGNVKQAWAKDLLNYGATSTLGINMTGSLTNADAIPTDPLGTLLPYGTELARIGRDAVQFARQPNSWNAKRFAYQMAPNSAKGLMENALFTDEKGNFYNPNNAKGELINQRTPTDEVKRAFSFRPLEESKMKQAASALTDYEEMAKTTKANILNRTQADMNSVDMKGAMPEQDRERMYLEQYIANGGDPRSLTNDQIALLTKGKHLNQLQREQGIPKGSLAEIMRYRKGQEFSEDIGVKK